VPRPVHCSRIFPHPCHRSTVSCVLTRGLSRFG
jgi:hypothetical protein